MGLAQRLEQQIPEILRQWEARVRSSVPAARHQSRPILLNSIPDFLKELVRSLAGPAAQESAKREAPKEHATQRAAQPEYSLEQVIQEYSLLRGTLLDVLGSIDPPDLRIVLEIIDAAVADATTQYVELQSSAIRESEERFRLLVDSVRDYAIFLLDLGGRVLTWNPGIERITGYRADEITGQHTAIFYLQEDRTLGTPQRNLEFAAREGRFETEGWRVRKDGSRFFAHVLFTAMRREDGTLRGYSKVIRDISERRSLEMELQARADALAEANRRKDEFLAVLAHELRNPLAPIVSSVEILRGRHITDPDAQLAIDVIENQGGHLVRLVDDLLDVARITRGQISLRKEPLELIHMLEQVVETIRPFAIDQGQTLTVSLPREEIWLEADGTRLSQVFANLLHNSVKFTGREGRIALRAWREDSAACVEVSDTGSGLNPKEIPRLFDIFVQGEQPANRIVMGLGIGLALVRTIVQMHEGSVSAFSEGRGKGSRFVVRLPVHHVERRDISSATIEKAFAAARVLVVDDNVDAATTVAMLLQMCGHTVRIAHSGPEAIESALAEPPDAILLDLGLPGMDGYDVARRLRAQAQLKHVRLIALSGFGREHDRRLSREVGFDAHLIKPASVADMQEAIAAPTRAG